MEKLLPILLLLIINFQIFSQGKEEKLVAETVEKLRLAMIDGNKSELERLSHANLSYGHSNGKIENQAQFVEAIASGYNNFEKIDLSEQTIKIIGKTAMVRHHFKAISVNDGKPASANISVLQVYIKNGKNWLLLARQAVKI